jgi:hypothetical protein
MKRRSEIYICSVIMNIKLMKTIRPKENIVLMYTFRPDLDCGRFLHMIYSSFSIVSMCQMNRLRRDLIFCLVLYKIYMSELQLFGTIEVLAVFWKLLLLCSTDLDKILIWYFPWTVPLSHKISAL